VQDEGGCGCGDEIEGCGGPARRRKTRTSALRRGKVQGGGNTGKRKSEWIYLRVFPRSTLFVLVDIGSIAALHSFTQATDQRVLKKSWTVPRGKVYPSIPKRRREYQVPTVVGVTNPQQNRAADRRWTGPGRGLRHVSRRAGGHERDELRPVRKNLGYNVGRRGRGSRGDSAALVGNQEEESLN